MTATAPNRERRALLDAFYAKYHHNVHAVVRYRARPADDAIIDDACAIAWLKLVGRPDIDLDARGVAWLKLTATREAWRCMDRNGEILAGVFLTNPDHPDEIADPATLDGDPVAAAVNHETQRERVELFAALKPNERRDLLLAAAGYTYTEIARRTGSTYTAVNRRITEGSARLRPVQRRSTEIRRGPAARSRRTPAPAGDQLPVLRAGSHGEIRPLENTARRLGKSRDRRAARLSPGTERSIMRRPTMSNFAGR